MKKILFLTAGIFFLASGCQQAKVNKVPQPVACTQEAKLCPDGSAVGRSGPNCEFAACPSEALCEGGACPEIKSSMTEAQAKAIAEKTCIKGGEALFPGYYNQNSKTWWFDANLNATRPGCNPACVVSEQTKTAEINWRCTGLKQ